MIELFLKMGRTFFIFLFICFFSNTAVQAARRQYLHGHVLEYAGIKGPGWTSPDLVDNLV
jgi:hypothetical protein